MGTRFSRLLDVEPPADAIVYKGMRYTLDNDGPRPGITIWYGKSKRPKRWGFRNESHRQEYIAREQEKQDSDERYKLQRIAERDQQQAAQSAQIQVGTLLCNSWGWEQTNIDFYQVVKRSGRAVWIQAIAGQEVPGSNYGGMSNKVKAVRDAFLEDSKPIRKLIGPHGITMPHGYTSITDETREHYQSWYA